MENIEQEKLLPVGTPSSKQQSWGAIISIIVIILMVIVGAFYAWGERISEQKAAILPETTK